MSMSALKKTTALVVIVLPLLISEAISQQDYLSDGSTQFDDKTTTKHLTKIIGEDVSISCAVNRDDSQINVWYKDNIEIKFNLKTRVHYCFSNPRMVLEQDGSLKIRNAEIGDSGNYFCGGNSSTILKIQETNNLQNEMENNSQLVSNIDHERGQESRKNSQLVSNIEHVRSQESRKNSQLVSTITEKTGQNSRDNTTLLGKSKVEANENKPWMIIVIVVLVLFVIILVIFPFCHHTYKEKQAMRQSTHSFSPINNGTESGYALKDFMEVEEDLTKIPVTYR